MHVSRRGLLGIGVGLGALAAGVTVAVPAANAAGRDGAWCVPAQGRFPDGGHYGAPRGSVSHAGQDISNPTGTAVYAAAGGTVIRRQWGGGLTGRTGNGIVIDHGGVYTYYGHLNRYRVSVGDKVSAGNRIGDMGTSGNVTGPHLHFEVHTGSLGSTTNPVTYVRGRGVQLSGGWPTLDSGAQGSTVSVIQTLINAHGGDLRVDGDYGSISVSAVKEFQSDAGITVDGQVGPETWSELVIGQRQGASGTKVRALQRALNKRSAGLRVDGDFGSVTNSAVRSFQSVNQLVVDGHAGPVTWRALVG